MAGSETRQDVLRLPALGTSTGEARRFVAATLRGLGLDHLEDAATLAVSELVTNAVLHTRTEVDVTVRTDGERVRVEVGDRSDTLPAVRAYGSYATTGRGLGLVAAVTEDLGVQPREVGKAVWFTLPTSPEAVPEPECLPGLDLADLWDLDDPWDLADAPHLAAPAGRPTALLQHLPVALWLAAQQHHDALLRELVLYRGQDVADTPEAWAWYAAADAAHTALSAAVDQAVAAALQREVALVALPEGHPSPVPAMPATVDVRLSVDAGLPDALAALVQALAEADALARDGRLLAYPALPEIVALRTWCRDEVTAQATGAAPTPWRLELADEAGETRSAPVDWDERAVLDSSEAVVAADDRNRVLALSPAAERLLGWASADLAGLRLITIIPVQLREAHTAGFTRHQVTGQAHVLGVPLVLPVLHASGQEVRCGFLIRRTTAGGGRTVYLATLTALED